MKQDPRRAGFLVGAAQRALPGGRKYMKNKRAYFSQARNKGAIAILGGMGPEASAKMLEVMVSMAAEKFGAKDCRDFPEIIVDSVPVPDFISSKKNLPLARKMLIGRVKKLNSFNVAGFAIACNTAHILVGDLQRVAGAPFISMIDSVSDEVVASGITKVGLLATPSTINSGLYQEGLSKNGINLILPTKAQMSCVEGVIRRVISKKNSGKDVKKLEKIAKSFEQKGARGIILGCTELPLVFPKDFSLPVFDSIEILSMELLAKYYKNGGKRYNE